MAYVAASGELKRDRVPIGTNPILLLLAVGGLLGTSAVFAKAAPGLGWTPIILLQWSMLGSALIQGGVLLWRARGKAGAGQTPATQRQLVTYMAVAGGLFALPNAIGFTAAPQVGAGFISLCLAFPLVLTYGLSVVLKLERFQTLRALGVVMGLVGGVLLVSDGQSLDPQARLWAIGALLMPVIIAVGNIYRTLKWPHGASPLLLSTGMMAFGGGSLVLVTLGLGLPQVPTSISGAALGLAAAQALVFAVQYVFYFQLQKVAGPVYLSQIGSVAAVTGLGLAFLTFGEMPGWLQFSAVGAIGLGILLVSYRR